MENNKEFFGIKVESCLLDKLNEKEEQVNCKVYPTKDGPVVVPVNENLTLPKIVKYVLEKYIATCNKEELENVFFNYDGKKIRLKGLINLATAVNNLENEISLDGR